MSINILDLAKSYLTTGAVEKLSSFVSESATDVKSGLGAILPTLLGAIIEKASTSDGVIEIMGLLQKQKEPGLANKFTSSLGDSTKIQDLLAEGESILPAILGKSTREVSESLALSSGMKSGSVSSLISISMPFLISVIGQQFESNGMGLYGLTNMLMDQKAGVAAAMPLSLARIVNFSYLKDFRPGIEHGVLPEDENTQKRSKSDRLPWLIGALVLLVIMWWLRNCREKQDHSGETTVVVEDSVQQSGNTLVSESRTVASHLGVFFKKRLPGGVELNIPEQGIENNLIKFIEDPTKSVDKTTWFNFDRIIFETGSSRLRGASLEQTENLASILKAYPDVNLKIGGYTDNTGDSVNNLKLSDERAKAVKAAIENEGVSQERLEAEGYGNAFPVASNETEEGRTRNRRISVRVIKK